MPMFVLGIIFGMSSVAHAQMVCSLSVAAATPRAILTGHTEPAGDVTVTCAAPVVGTVVTSAILIVDYGATITDTSVNPGFGQTAWPSGSTGIRIANCTGDFAAQCAANGGSPPTSNGLGLSSFVSAGTAVNVQVPALTTTVASSSFKITGVLLSIPTSGKTAGQSLSATIFPAVLGQSYAVNGGADSAITITALNDGIVDAGVTRVLGPAIANTNGVALVNTFSVSVTENAIDTFRTQPQVNTITASPGGGGSQTNGAGTAPISAGQSTQVRFLFTGIPAGVIIGGCSATVAAAGTTSVTPNVSQVSVDASAPFITVFFTGAGFDLTVLDTITLTCNQLSVTSGTTLTPGSVTVQASLSPCASSTSTPLNGCVTGGATSSLGSPLTSLPTGQIPRYAVKNVPATGIPVVAIAPSTTTLLVPFAVAGVGGYDTGIAIGNTTSDPFGSLGGALAQNGTITYNFFPTKGTSFSVVTSATGAPAGNGGLTSGAVNAGDTYAVLVSDLLKAAGKPAAFTGYIFVTTQFTNAHGIAYISTAFGPQTVGNAFTSATPLLVMPSPSIVPRQSAGGVETLAQ